jgi:hypothetical protein
MARPKKNQEEYLPEQEDNKTTDNNLSSILKEHKEEHYNFQERVNWKISTGSLLLDMSMGGGINPCLLRLCGNNNEGKTPQALELLRNFLNTVPNSKAFWIIAEGRGLSDENQQRCQLKFVYSAEDWKVGTVFVLESNVFELFVKCVKDLVLNNPDNCKYAFVVDSVDGLQLRDDKEKDISGNNRVAGTPMLSKKMLQSLSLGMFKYGHLLILISQVTSEIKLDPYAKTADRGGNFSGGNSLLHGSDWILEYQKTHNSDVILDNPSGKLNDGKSKPIGKWCKVQLQKSALEASRKQIIQYPIKFGKKPSGIWIEYELVDSLLAWGLIKKSGTAWLVFSDSLISELKEEKIEIEKQHQGGDKLRKYLEENPNITEFLVKKFKTVLS